MKTLLGLSIGAVAALLVDAPTVNNAQSVPEWIWRAFVTILLGIIAWLIKAKLKEAEENNKERDDSIKRLVKITTAHEVMFQVWLDEISAGNPHPPDGKRQSDKLYNVIKSLAEVQNRNG